MSTCLLWQYLYYIRFSALETAPFNDIINNLVLINNVSIVVAKSIRVIGDECPAPRGQRFGVYITFDQILIHTFIHQICICERPVGDIGLAGKFFPWSQECRR